MTWIFEHNFWYIEDNYNCSVQQDRDENGEKIYSYYCQKKGPIRWYQGVRSSLTDAMEACEQIFLDTSK